MFKRSRGKYFAGFIGMILLGVLISQVFAGGNTSDKLANKALKTSVKTNLKNLNTEVKGFLDDFSAELDGLDYSATDILSVRFNLFLEYYNNIENFRAKYQELLIADAAGILEEYVASMSSTVEFNFGSGGTLDKYMAKVESIVDKALKKFTSLCAKSDKNLPTYTFRRIFASGSENQDNITRGRGENDGIYAVGVEVKTNESSPGTYSVEVGGLASSSGDLPEIEITTQNGTTTYETKWNDETLGSFSSKSSINISAGSRGWITVRQNGKEHKIELVIPEKKREGCPKEYKLDKKTLEEFYAKMQLMLIVDLNELEKAYLETMEGIMGEVPLPQEECTDLALFMAQFVEEMMASEKENALQAEKDIATDIPNPQDTKDFIPDGKGTTGKNNDDIEKKSEDVTDTIKKTNKKLSKVMEKAGQGVSTQVGQFPHVIVNPGASGDWPEDPKLNNPLRILGIVGLKNGSESTGTFGISGTADQSKGEIKVSLLKVGSDGNTTLIEETTTTSNVYQIWSVSFTNQAPGYYMIQAEQDGETRKYSYTNMPGGGR